MKHRIMLIATLLLGVLAALPQPSTAQEAGQLQAAVIGIVDMQGILRQAEAARDIRRQIDEKRESYGREARQQEEALKQDEQALQQQRAILSQEAFNQRRQEFQRKVQEFQRFVQVRTRQLDQGFSIAMEEVRKALIEVIAEIVREKGIDVVLGKGTIVMANTQLDISQEALDRLNGRLQAVPVQLPPLSEIDPTQQQ